MTANRNSRTDAAATSIHVRKLTRADAGAMARLETEIYPTSLRAGRSQLRRDLMEAEWDDSNLSYGLFDGDELVGVLVVFYESDCRRLYDYFGIPRPADVVAEECVFVADFSVRRAYSRYTPRLMREAWTQNPGHHQLPVLGFSPSQARDRWLARRRAFRCLGYEFSGDQRFELSEPPHEIFLVRFDASRPPRYVLAGTARPRVEIIKNHTGWRQLASEWDSLLYQTPDWTAFQTFQMQQIWWKHFASERRLWIIVVRDGDRLRAVAPFRIEVTEYLGRPRRLLCFIGEPSEMDRPTILRRGEDQEAVETIFDYLARHRDVWDSLYLYEQPSGGLVANVARARFDPKYEMVGVRPGPPCPWVDLSGSWDAFMASKSRSFRKGLRRKLAALKRRGKVEFETVGNGAGLASAFEEYLGVESRSWKPEKQLGAAKNQAYLDYHRELVDELGRGGRLIFRMVYVDRKPIAATFGLFDHGRFFSLHIAHDREYDKFSPGMLLTAYELEECYARDDHSRYEFLGGYLENKLSWTSNVRDTEQLYVYRREFLFRIHYAWHFRIEPRLKTMLKRLRLFDAVVGARNAIRSLWAGTRRNNADD